MSKTSQNDSQMRFGTGLLPTPHDPRDISLGSVYGKADIKDVPFISWVVKTPKAIKDQGQKDFCAGYATAAVSEDQEEIIIDGDFQFAAICKVRNDYKSWGANLRDALKSAIDIGSVSVDYGDLFRRKNPEADRDFLADWRNWPKSYFTIAEGYKKGSYFEIKGQYDHFDNVRAHLWKHKNDCCTVLAGVIWRYQWNSVLTGVIPATEGGQGEGHAIKICGQKIINGEPYLIIQNSWGEMTGHNGLFYVNREMFNANFANFGLYMLKDLPKEVAKYISSKDSLSVKDVWWVKPWLVLIRLFTSYTHK